MQVISKPLTAKITVVVLELESEDSLLILVPEFEDSLRHNFEDNIEQSVVDLLFLQSQ